MLHSSVKLIAALFLLDKQILYTSAFTSRKGHSNRAETTETTTWTSKYQKKAPSFHHNEASSSVSMNAEELLSSHWSEYTSENTSDLKSEYDFLQFSRNPINESVMQLKASSCIFSAYQTRNSPQLEDTNLGNETQEWYNTNCSSFLVQNRLVIYGNLHVDRSIFIMAGTTDEQFETLEYQVNENGEESLVSKRLTLDRFTLELCKKDATIINESLFIKDASLIVSDGGLIVYGNVYAGSGIDISNTGYLEIAMTSNRANSLLLESIFKNRDKNLTNPLNRENENINCPVRSQNTLKIEDGIISLRNSSMFYMFGDIYTDMVLVSQSSEFQHFCGTINTGIKKIQNGSNLLVTDSSRFFSFGTHSVLERVMVENSSCAYFRGNFSSSDSVGIKKFSSFLGYGTFQSKQLIALTGSSLLIKGNYSDDLSLLSPQLTVSDLFYLENNVSVLLESGLDVGTIECIDSVTLRVDKILNINGRTSLRNNVKLTSERINSKGEITILFGSHVKSSEIFIQENLVIDENSALQTKKLSSKACLFAIGNSSTLDVEEATIKGIEDCMSVTIYSTNHSKTNVRALYLENPVSSRINNEQIITTPEFYIANESGSVLELNVLLGSFSLLSSDSSLSKISIEPSVTDISFIESRGGSSVTLNTQGSVNIKGLVVLNNSKLKIAAMQHVEFAVLQSLSNSQVEIESYKTTAKKTIETSERSSVTLTAEFLTIPNIMSVSDYSTLELGSKKQQQGKCNMRISTLIDQLADAEENTWIIRNKSKIKIHGSIQSAHKRTFDIHNSAVMISECEQPNLMVYKTADSSIDLAENVEVKEISLLFPISINAALPHISSELNNIKQLKHLSNTKRQRTESQDDSLWNHIYPSILEEVGQHNIETYSTNKPVEHFYDINKNTVSTLSATEIFTSRNYNEKLDYLAAVQNKIER